MDFATLANSQGIWAAVAIFLAIMYDRVRREQLVEKDKQIADCQQRNKDLEDEARKTVSAKDTENAEWKRIALSALEKPRGSR